MYPLPKGVVARCGVIATCLEAAYMADKFDDLEKQIRIARVKNGRNAKKLASQLVEKGAAIVRPDWEDDKLAVMRSLIQQKFERDSVLADRLIGTGNAHIIEGNTWGDTYWGESPVGNGENHLGILLMERRQLLKSDREGLTGSWQSGIVSANALALVDL